MRTNLFKKVTALGMATAMLVSTNAFATDLTSNLQTIAATSTSTVESPIYKVKVPTTIAFTLDPMELKAPTAQSAINVRTRIIAPGKGYSIVNLSNIDVNVNVEASVVAKSGVYVVSMGAINTLYTDPGTLATNGALNSVIVPKDVKNREKEVSMFLLVAQAAKTAAAAGTANDPTVVTYASLGAKAMNIAAPGSQPAKVSFLLRKGNPVSSGAPTKATSAGLGVFSIQGDINTLAPWAPSDVTVAVKYTIEGMTAAKSATLESGVILHRVSGGSLVASTVAFVAPEAPTMSLATFTKPATTTAAVADMTPVTFDPGDGYRALVADGFSAAYVVKILGGTVPLTLSAADFVVEDTAKTLTIKASGATKFKSYAAATGVYQIELTYKNGRTVTGPLTIENAN